MFGFSLAELLVVLIIAFIFIKPQDLPEIAHFIGRLYYKGRKLVNDLKNEFKEVEKELGLEDLKHEINRGITDEKIANDSKTTTKIIDIYGNEHEIDPDHLPSDLSKEEIETEIKKYNELHQKPPQP